MNDFQKNKEQLFNLVTGLQSYYETNKNEPKAIKMLKEGIEFKIKEIFKLVDEKRI